LTEKIDYKGFSRDWRARHRGVESANEYFWAHFPLEASSIELEAMNDTAVPDDLKGVLKHTVPHTGVIIDAVSNMPKLMRLHSIIRKYVAPLGFNLVQLRLVGKAGFSFMPSSLPNLGQSILSDNENPLYAPEELSSLVESAAAVGVAIMPEITVSTEAAGWIQAGFTIDCPLRFCKGKSLPNNVNSQELLPVLYSVIGELRTIFTSSKLFHLGTDERSAAAACWEEAGEAPDYDKFESRMEALLALVNLAPEETLRWENGEGFRYPGRAGGVTQFPAGQLDEIRPDEPFFLTIDLFEGNAYNIFKNAKKAVSLKPLGVLADLPKLSESKFDNWEIPKRLLAFSMGVSELANAWSFNEEATFESEFEQLCRALNLADDCSPPDDQHIDVDLVPESPEFIQKQCETFVTEFENILIAKKPVLPWFENGVARIEAQIS
jgi:Glycosyl hydrolase family 20, catalytic domain